MKKLYFSKIIFIKGSNAKNELTQEEINLLNKISTYYMDRDLCFDVEKPYKNDKKITIGIDTIQYSPAGVVPKNNDFGLSGSIIKGAKIIRKFYDREQPEEITIERNDTEYKINFYYDSTSKIVAFTKTDSFGEKEFNDAFANLMEKSIRKNLSDTQQHIPDFKIAIDFIRDNLNPCNIIEEITAFKPIAKLKYTYRTTDIIYQLHNSFDNSKINKFTFNIESKDPEGINIDNDIIKTHLEMINVHLYSLNKEVFTEEEIQLQNDMKSKTSLSIVIEDVNGNISNTIDNKYKCNVEENLNEVDFENFVLSKIENLKYL